MKHWEDIVVSSDHHVPFHNVRLHRGFCRFLGDFRPDRFILLGDFMDLYVFGSYHKNSLHYLKDISLDDEYDAGCAVLDDYDTALGKTRKDYLYGNHEDRFWRWKKEGDNAKVGERIGSPTRELSLIERGYSVQDDWKNSSIKIGQYSLVHGDSVAVNAASAMLIKYLRSLIFGHVHRPQMATRGEHTAYALGAMCDIYSPGMSYMPTMQRDAWRNGFAVLRHNVKTDQVVVEPVTVDDGMFFFGNTRY